MKMTFRDIWTSRVVGEVYLQLSNTEPQLW